MCSKEMVRVITTQTTVAEVFQSINVRLRSLSVHHNTTLLRLSNPSRRAHPFRPHRRHRRPHPHLSHLQPALRLKTLIATRPTTTAPAPAPAPARLLRLLLDSDARSANVLSFLRWSEKQFRSPHGLDIHCRLLHSLAAEKRYPDIRSQLHTLVRSGRHSIPSIFHALSLSGDRRDHNSIITDMLVLALVKNAQTDPAVEAFHWAGDYGYRLSILSCNPLLNALIKERRIETSEAVYKEMIRRRVSPDPITFNTVINGLCKAGKLQRAGDLVEDMRAWGFSPSVITYNTLIDGHCKKGRVGKMYKADALLKEMVSVKVQPTL